MKCPKGKKEYHDKAKIGRYYCKRCGSVSKKKRDFCKSKKIKNEEDLQQIEELISNGKYEKAA